MNLLESFRLAMGSIVSNRMRAALTMLGIIIGVGAVIGLISLGRGVEGYVNNEFAALGSNLLTVRSSTPDSDTRTRIEPLTMNDVAALSQPTRFPYIQQVGAEFDTTGFVAAPGENLRLTVKGVTPNIGEIRNWKTAAGSYITAGHVEGKQRVAVLGADVVEDLYGAGDVDPIGRLIRINTQPFTVIGVMEERSGGFNSENSTVIVPISTAQTRLSDARVGSSYEVTTMLVQATAEQTVDLAERDLDQYLFDAHNIRFDGEQDYSILNQSDLLDAVGAITGLLTVFLSLIASISLLVGGIGIMNGCRGQTPRHSGPVFDGESGAVSAGRYAGGGCGLWH